MQTLPTQMQRRLLGPVSTGPRGAAFRSAPRVFRRRSCHVCSAQQEQATTGKAAQLWAGSGSAGAAPAAQECSLARSATAAGAQPVEPVTPKIETNVQLDLDKEVGATEQSADASVVLV